MKHPLTTEVKSTRTTTPCAESLPDESEKLKDQL
jgi:hypothetical protein